MEEMILAAGDALNGQIEQERVRQMLFLSPTQHVALHFKVTKDHQLFFIYASVVSEKDVILQTRPQLLMGDPCMTDPLPGAALLPGGTDMKAIPWRGPPPGSTNDMYFDRGVDNQMSEADRDYQLLLQRGEVASDDLRGRSDTSDVDNSRPRRRRSIPKRMQDDELAQFMPRMAYKPPEMPLPPFRIQDPPREEDRLGRPICSSLDSLKKPLIFPVSARAILSPTSARSAQSTVRSEHGGYGDSSSRPPLAPESSTTEPAVGP